MIPVHAAAARNTRSAAENDNPILHPAGFYRTADYEDIERIKHHEQETCSIVFCVRHDRKGYRDTDKGNRRGHL